MKDTSPRMNRWLEKLQRFNFEIRHIPGTTNTAADALSRNLSLCPVTTEDWLPAYRQSPHCSQFFNDDGTLNGKADYHNGRLWQNDLIIVPSDQQIIRNTISRHHDGVVEGHWGIAKTQEIMKRRYIFPEMENSIRDYCLNCDICQRIKVDRSKRKGLLVNLTLPENPWQSISIDWITKLPTITSDEKDYNTILVVVDRLTKMVHLMPSNEMKQPDKKQIY